MKLNLRQNGIKSKWIRRGFVKIEGDKIILNTTTKFFQDINGEFTSGKSTDRIPIINPATEETLDVVPRGTPQDAANAVDAASTAFQEWMRTPSNERAAALHEVATKIRSHHDEIVRILTQEEGKPVPENDVGCGREYLNRIYLPPNREITFFLN